MWFYVCVVFVNGKFCKDPKFAYADDFFFGGLGPGNTAHKITNKLYDDYSWHKIL